MRVLGVLRLKFAGGVAVLLFVAAMPVAAQTTLRQRQRDWRIAAQALSWIRTQLANTATVTVSFRLDPWLISGNYGGGFWASPPVLGPVAQSGDIFAIETRASAVDVQGQALTVSPEWISSDPSMATVTPTERNTVIITVQRGGQCQVDVIFPTASKVLSIKAVRLPNSMQVEIAQK